MLFQNVLEVLNILLSGVFGVFELFYQLELRELYQSLQILEEHFLVHEDFDRLGEDSDSFDGRYQLHIVVGVLQYLLKLLDY